MRALLGVHCLFTLYGSFIPFRFSADPDWVRQRLAHALVLPFQGGVRNFSIPDVVSNVLLFVPFGFLLVAGGLRAAADRVGWRQIAAAGSLAAAFATTTEAGQVLTVDRTASCLDVLANTAGALLGAVGARALLPAAGWRISETVRRLLRECPTLVPLGLLALALAADRFYPFAVTLDVSTAWSSLKHTQLEPFGSLRRRSWTNVLMNNVVIFALFAALVRAAGQRYRRSVPSGGLVWAGVVSFAACLEAGKLFFAGRFPNVDNVLLPAFGAFLGVTLLPVLLRWGLVRSRPGAALFGLAVVLLAYAELTPFDFALAPSAIAAKAAHIEWLPFASHYRADPQSALLDLWNKLLLSGFLGFAVLAATSRGRREATTAGLAVGGLLECAQVLKVTRIPSVTDVLVFGFGAYLGGAAQVRYRGWKQGRLLSY